ncbi:hypothetical protein CERZMDRAFT_83832 [Cercospora zeae-maydis SCOH1-5]|uniref:BZIP domain-containing protein n=1 Tax=Cercospora zeae-maydis SCOH1-5 TaxID=717836 RepID=A0A6A6FK02_9PEZI|nr:hypothetical protein CERZMDRAFT_83832 [Cercospora zeae-maydis SCOH1-5]
MADQSDWKAKFSQQQLDKKRWMDRRKRKKSRQNSKQTVAELEEQLQLLLSGDHASVILQLREENRTLRTRLSQYQTRLASLIFSAKELLDEDGELDLDLGSGMVLDPEDRPTQVTVQAAQAIEVEDLSTVWGDEHMRCSSLLCEIFSLSSPLGRSTPPEEEMSSQKLLELTITWKLFGSPHESGYKGLLERFGLAKSPSRLTSGLLELSIRHDPHPTILDAIMHHKDADYDDIAKGDGSPVLEPIRQKRAVAICAYETTRMSQRFFKGPLEFATMFWALYTYYMVKPVLFVVLRDLGPANSLSTLQFLIFPTQTNLERCPPWHRPRLPQLINAHPSWMDFLVWPALRERLVTSQSDYDPRTLVVDLIKNFEMKNFDRTSHDLFTISPDGTELLIDPSFESAIWSLDNFVTHSTFMKKYPDLASFVVSVDMTAPTLLHTQQLPHALPSNNTRHDLREAYASQTSNLAQRSIDDRVLHICRNNQNGPVLGRAMSRESLHSVPQSSLPRPGHARQLTPNELAPGFVLDTHDQIYSGSCECRKDLPSWQSPSYQWPPLNTVDLDAFMCEAEPCTNLMGLDVVMTPSSGQR